MPVNAPCDAAVEPIVVPALNTKFEFKGELFPRSSTIVIPGKTLEPKLLMPTDAGENGWPIVLYIFSRLNPNTSVTLRFGRMDCVFVRDATWLPASRCCENPSTAEYPNGAVVGSCW